MQVVGLLLPIRPEDVRPSGVTADQEPLHLDDLEDSRQGQSDPEQALTDANLLDRASTRVSNSLTPARFCSS
jgi:hypothetical protein